MADELINPLVKLVQERLPWLLSENGFKIIDYSYDRTGSGQVILESEQLRISFVRNRGFSQVHLAARSDLTTSYELSFLMLALQDKRPDIGFEGNAALLRDNWALLLNALGPKLAETKREYERREQISREAIERFQSSLPITPRGFVNDMRKTAVGRILYPLLRLLEIVLLLWALHTVITGGAR
jgi:hypothetical protein